MAILYGTVYNYFVILDSARLRFFFDTLDTIDSNMLLQYGATTRGWTSLGLGYRSWQYPTQKILIFLGF